MKDIIICDLDGTLADIAHRRHFVTNPAISGCPDCGGKNSKACVSCTDMAWDKFKPNWPAFHKACVDDTPLETTIELINNMISMGFEIWITSGRSDEVKSETMHWLSQNLNGYENLIMRKQGDYTPDDVLKKSWLDNGTIPKERVFCAFDDRDRVVQMWRNEGLTCYQVAPGNF